MASIAIKSNTTFICLSIFILFTLTTTTMAHNITKILSSEPDLSQFNSYLSQTKLADEINSRQTITVLALDNSAMSTLTSNQSSLSAIKNILSLHVLLDYYDPKKLHSIQNGTVATTTLYQTTGSAAQGEGLVNITDLRGGSVGFGSGVPDSKLGSTYTKSIKQIPYNISVLQINKPIIVPSMLTSSSSSSDTNLTAVLDKGGCKTFASMLSQSGVLKMYQTQMENGITIFAPNDEAFKAKGIPDFTKLSSAELVSLLQFHALSSYSPIGTLKSSKGSLKTLAGDGKYYLSPSTAGDSITLHTNVDSSRIASTLLDSTPTVIYSVDNVLLPVALFGMAPSPSPTPSESPESSPSPAPASPSPSPSGVPESSPPAPTAETPEGSPSESPADSPGVAADESSNNGGEGTSVPALSVALVALSGVICLML